MKSLQILCERVLYKVTLRKKGGQIMTIAVSEYYSFCMKYWLKSDSYSNEKKSFSMQVRLKIWLFLFKLVSLTIHTLKSLS